MAQIYKLHHRKASFPYPTLNIRPFKIHYYYSLHDNDVDVAKSIGCSNEVNALKSSVTRLIIGQYAKATVHNEDGVVIYRLSRKRNQINILGMFIKYEDWIARLERERKAKEKLMRQMEENRSNGG